MRPGGRDIAYLQSSAKALVENIKELEKAVKSAVQSG
jgi:hypothetical protein